jgi:amino acid adenylation domain-containing protein
MNAPDRDDAQDLLSQLLTEEGFEPAHPLDAPISRREFAGPSPAGFAQELVWLLDRADPGNTAYNMALSRRAIGRLDVAALKRTLQELIARHEAFRTTFVPGPDFPLQVIREPRPVELLLLDLRRLPVADREPAARRTLEERSRTPFDLASDQLLRATVVQLADTEHFLLIETNHIVYDGWSSGLVIREIEELYTSFVTGRAPSLPPAPPIRYRDYAAWERERLQGPRLAELLDYWRIQLADVPASLELPTDRPREAAPRFEGGQVECLLPPATLEELRRLAKDHDATLYMVLLAGFQTVLHRWSGQETIVTGSANAGRLHPETEGVVGYLANTLVLRTGFAGDPTFAALLDRVRETCLGAYDHQEIPLEKLVLELRRDRVGSPAPLFQVVLTMQNVAGDPLELPGVTLEPLGIAAGATKFDLTLFPGERPEGLRLALAYRSDIFDATTATRFLGHLATALTAAVAAPETPVSTLPLLTTPERRELTGWNATDWTEGPASTITAMFETRARTHPDREAVRSGETGLTYAALEANANRIAQWLIQHGVTTGTPVGLCLERSTGMIEGLLGVLKAGGMYIPLVPDLPAARLAQQVAEGGAQIVVTTAEYLPLLPSGLTVLTLDRDAAELAALPASPPPARSGPADPAYVLFTSGSTGTPKGVTVTHGNVVHYTRAIARVLELDLAGNHDPWQCGTVSTLGADLGNTAIFPALLSGGTLHVLPGPVAMDAARFAEYVAAHPLDLLKITPNHLRALLAGRAAADILPQRWLVVGGEACPWDLAAAVRDAGRCRMLNHYGPTETTVGVCTYEIGARPGGPGMSSTVPIGLPLANTHAYVLDGRGQELPVGIPGELFIGGLGVAIGYLNRPDLTAERFVTRHGERLYRTGDRVRRLPTGDLEFLGRADDQVKIRGYRVEPGEVEAVLTSLPGVRQAAVVARPAADAALQLVAYVSADPSQPNDALAAGLAERLPAYMVPAAWVRLESLPLNANGKVDRRALPEPQAASLPESNGAPNTETQRALVALWSDVLKRDAVGIHANFFELGGHSLLAIRLLGRIAKQFGVRLSLRALFDAPTIEQLAELLTPRHPMEAPLAALWAEVLKKDAVGRDDDFFALGGHSLLAIRLLGRIARQFGVRLPLRTLFDHPTVAGLAPLIAPPGEALPAQAPTSGPTRRSRTPLAPGSDDRREG